MSVVKFAEEFTQLLARWTNPLPKEDDKDNPVKQLTKQQLVNAIQSVMNTMLDVSLQVPDNSSTTTPKTGIVICTPNAPVVPKTYPNPSNGSLSRFRSLDTLTSLRQTNNNINTFGYEPLSSSRSQERMVVREDKEAEFTPKERKKTCPQPTSRIRRLSVIGTSGTNRISSIKRPIQPPKLRRSSTGLPGTPTSSKSGSTLSVNKTSSSVRRKSISASVINTKSSKISPSSTPATKKKAITSDKPKKYAPNPKYAHIQSTIPKASVTIKKSQ